MNRSFILAAIVLGTLASCKQKTNDMNTLQLTQEWDKVFPLSEKVNHQKVTYMNHFGIALAADVYTPKDASGELPALVVGGPFGAVKEQVSGLYAMRLAERGFVAIAADPSYMGESGGEPRGINSPDLNIEDFQAGVDYLMTRVAVDPERVGIIGICGWAAQTFTSMQNTQLLTYAGEIRNPVLMVHGQNAHSLYFAQGAFDTMTGTKPEGSVSVGNKEFLMIPGAAHCDLYDEKAGVIPWDKLETFFKENLK